MAPQVVMIAATNLYRERIRDRTFYIEHDFESDTRPVLAADELVEIVGRTCQRAVTRDRGRGGTRTNREYVRDVLLNGEASFLDHASATFLVESVGQLTARALWRHRGLSISETSMRDAPTKAWLAVPPKTASDPGLTDLLVEHFDRCGIAADEAASLLRQRGVNDVQAKREALAYMPMCTDTSLVVTGSMRVWRDVLAVELVSRDSECRELALMLLSELHMYAPNTFQDKKAAPVNRPARTAVAGSTGPLPLAASDAAA